MAHISLITIVVSGFNNNIKIAHKKAIEIFEKTTPNIEFDNGYIEVSPIIYTCNGYGTFFIPPDGSKIGWAEHMAACECREKFVYWLTHEGKQYYFDWFEISYGSDHAEAIIRRHSEEGTMA